MADPSDRKGRADERSEQQGLSPTARDYQAADRYIGASFSLVAAVGVFTALGIWVDKKIGGSVPWFTILGAILGMTGGFISFFRKVLSKNGP